jgi:SET domain-containing protein
MLILNISTFEELMKNERTVLNPYVMNGFFESCNDIKDLVKAIKYLEVIALETDKFMKSFDYKFRMRFFEKRNYKNLMDENRIAKHWINLLTHKVIKLRKFSKKPNASKETTP